MSQAKQFNGGDKQMMTSNAAQIVNLVASDPRADGGLRQICLKPGAVSIDRRVGGVQMRLALPISCFTGVSLALLGSARGGFYYRVALQHKDPELAVTLAESEYEADIASEWRAWAQYFQLPRLSAGPGASFEVIDGRLGEVAVKAVQPRKRGWPLKTRRSTMSARRKTGPKVRKTAVHRGEREIVCYE